ncbi:MAG: hypothetical protein P8P30_07965 [Rickettsiales bacterium]|nr:hypothetical protein [Rickettsiales bacterium]
MDAPKVIDKQTIQRHRLADLQQFMTDKKPLAIKRTLEDLQGYQFANLDEQANFEKIYSKATEYLASPTAAKRIKELEKEQKIVRQKAEKARQKAETKAKREQVQKAKLEARLEKEAKKLLRINYPKETETNFLKQGMDVYITVEGRNKDILRLKYVLFSRPLVYQITNQGRLMHTWKTLGFKKVIFDTGYRRHWDIDLRD